MLRVMTFVAAVVLQAAALPAQSAQPPDVGKPRDPGRPMKAADPTPFAQSVAFCHCERTSKPQLTVWTSSACLPCRQFWWDLAGDRAFREAVLSHFHVQWVDFDSHHAARLARGITSASSPACGASR